MEIHLVVIYFFFPIFLKFNYFRASQTAKNPLRSTFELLTPKMAPQFVD
jgi:hypothetical protein